MLIIKCKEKVHKKTFSGLKDLNFFYLLYTLSGDSIVLEDMPHQHEGMKKREQYMGQGIQIRGAMGFLDNVER